MCTNFLLAVPQNPGSATPQMYVSARCLELTGALATSIYLVPAKQTFPLVAADQSTPWVGTYGFIGLADPNALLTFPCFMDGMNEVGLSFAALWLPGTQYPSSGSTPMLDFYDLGAWVLSSYATVQELEQQGLSTISIVGPGPSPCQLGYLPLHFIATDPTGASLVLEFINGSMNVYAPDYDNGATADGVLTNAPTYDWQRANLANYANLTVEGAGTTVSGPPGPPVGSGLLGLPGDPMSASRFVKAATFRQGFGLLPPDGTGWLPTPKDAGATASAQTIVNVAMQMVQMIQATPYGTALITPKTAGTPPTVGDWTQWAVVRDHTNLMFYFSSAFNSTLCAVDLNSLDFSGPISKPGQLKSIAVLPGLSLIHI